MKENKKKTHGMKGKKNAIKEVKADSIINLRCTKSFKDSISKQAEKEQLTISALLTKIIDDYLSSEPEPQTEPEQQKQKQKQKINDSQLDLVDEIEKEDQEESFYSCIAQEVRAKANRFVESGDYDSSFDAAFAASHQFETSVLTTLKSTRLIFKDESFCVISRTDKKHLKAFKNEKEYQLTFERDNALKVKNFVLVAKLERQLMEMC